MENITAFFGNIGSANILVLAGIFIGSLLVLYGFFGGLVAANPVGRRYHVGRNAQRMSTFDAGLLNNADVDPKGLMKALMPNSKEKRSKVRRQLMNAGIVGRDAVARYYTFRIGLAILLPALYILVMVARQATFIPMPGLVADFIDGQSRLMTYYTLTGLTLFGFLFPAMWLRSKSDERQLEISESFPNALDLMQIAVEAGLGFDAAMTRVSNEMEVSAPAISQEFRLAQLEISAGADRERALMDMAARTNVDEVASFASVILQSVSFGTSVSDALMTYANEMRISRELKAQEMANKLPVKMSGVMATLMLPALFLLILGPIVIRWMNTFN